jgi:hypothetical protein
MKKIGHFTVKHSQMIQHFFKFGSGHEKGLNQARDKTRNGQEKFICSQVCLLVDKESNKSFKQEISNKHHVCTTPKPPNRLSKPQKLMTSQVQVQYIMKPLSHDLPKTTKLKIDIIERTLTLLCSTTSQLEFLKTSKSD